ncbi:MAG: RNA methyltransferase [Marinifilaceae bacterium]
MLSRAQIKHINSLHSKKHRYQDEMFIAEGSKIVLDLISNNIKVEYLVATSDWISNANVSDDIKIIESTEVEIKKCTALSTATNVIAIFHFPVFKNTEIKNSLSILLDDVQDPGNLGTIIRTADWFGIKNIFCSKGTVDIYNPKVIQATMGAIAGINIKYCNLEELIEKHSSEDFPVYGTFMEGNNIYSNNLNSKGFIVMGNEGKGVSYDIKALITTKLTIPSYNPNETISESLNVATATAIICSEFRRNSIK